MKPKQLLPLVVILGVLAALVAFREMKRRPPNLEQQYTLKRLLPADIDKAKIAKIELYAGGKPDAKLILERDGDATKWKVSSRWDAPVNQDKIDKFLKTLGDLRGEFRATVTGDGQKEYSVDDAAGFHVIGYAAGAKDPLFHLINGKSPDFGLAFARSSGSDDVHVINVSLRREAGIFTLEMGDVPEAGVWLDKTVFETPSDKIKAVSLVYPDKELSFELKEKPAEKKPETPADKPAADPANPAAETAKPAAAEPAKKLEWAVVKGGLGTEFHANGAANLARRLSRINASDLVDPAKKTDYGLQPPQYRATVTIEGQAAPTVIEVGRAGSDDTYAYFHVAGRPRDLVYKVSGADFEQIFYKGGEFFELPGVLVDKAEVDTIEYTIGGRAAKLAKDGEAWKVIEPKTDVAANSAAVNDLVRTLISWKADDFADAAEGKGLESPADKITFRGPKVEHTIELGGPTPAKGRYVRLDGRAQVLTMMQADVPAIFASYTKLFKSHLFDTDSSTIAKITLTKGDQIAHLERKADGSGWKVEIGGEKSELAAEGNADELAGALAGLAADDFDFDPARKPGPAFGKAWFATNDGKEYEVAIEAEDAKARYAAIRKGTAAVFLLPKTEVQSVFVDFAKLKPAPKPAPAAPAPAAPAASAPVASPPPAAPAAPAPAAPASGAPPADKPK